jgi:hypothetical protein
VTAKLCGLAIYGFRPCGDWVHLRATYDALAAPLVPAACGALVDIAVTHFATPHEAIGRHTRRIKSVMKAT